MSFTYTTLKSSVLTLAEDFSTEADSFFDTALMLAQKRMVRELDSYGFVLHARSSVSAGDPFVTKPPSSKVIKSLVIFAGNGTQTPLDLVTDEYIQEYWPIRTSMGTPVYYAQWDSSVIILAPTPSSAQDIEMSFVVQPTLVSSSHPTNWFTEEADDALLYATMVEMARFAKNKPAKDEYEGGYQGAMSALRNEARRSRRDDQRAPGSTVGENNLTEGSK